MSREGFLQEGDSEKRMSEATINELLGFKEGVFTINRRVEAARLSINIFEDLHERMRERGFSTHDYPEVQRVVSYENHFLK